MKALHEYISFIININRSLQQVPHLSTVYFSKMDLEQTVKDLQSQNTQFQQLLMTLAKRQEELKILLAEERKKKTKKVTRVLNMGRRFHGQTRRMLDFATTSGEGEGKGKETVIPSE